MTRTSKSANDNDNLNAESNFSKLSLIKEQQNDPKISVPYQKAPNQLDTAEDPLYYFINDGDPQMFQLMMNSLFDIKLLFLKFLKF